MEWRSVHVVYYEENKDALVLEGVRPLFRRLAPVVAAASYTRHWRLGPHLRLSLRCDADTMATTVRPAVDEIVGGFLARRPSRARLVPEDHLEAHRRLAQLEHETGPLLPWRPDNTLHEATFDGRTHVLGSEDAAELLADFYADSTDIAFRMTENVVGGGQRLSLAFDLMICTAHALSGVGLTTGFISFRSHAEAFLAELPESAELRPGWDRHYRRHAGSLRDRVARVVAALDERSGTVDFADDWTTLMRSYRHRARPLLVDGRLSIDPPMPTGGPERSTDPTQLSPYHRAALASPTVRQTVNAEWFVLYRLMLNLTYLHLTRLGVTPVERFLLCHLAANAVEDLYGISAMEQMEKAPPEPVLDTAGDPAS